MVFEFLAAEVYSGIFGDFVKGWLQRFGTDRSLIYTRNLEDPNANDLRRRVLAAYRGYRRNDLLFIGFPEVPEWKLVEVSVAELGDFYYAVSPGVQEWAVISKGSRLVRDGAKHIDDLPAAALNRSNTAAIETRLEQGHNHARLIAVSKDEAGPYILVEGHKRATAYLRVLDPTDRIEIILGFAPDLDSWAYALK